MLYVYMALQVQSTKECYTNVSNEYYSGRFFTKHKC